MSNYLAQELSPGERDAFLQRYERVLGKQLKPDHRKLLLADGFEVKGTFELTARNAETGAVEWQHAQDNLITDYGRFAFFDLGWQNVRIGFSPSTETPNIIRPGVPTDGSQVFVSGNLGSGTVTPSTYTKTWTAQFLTPPPANRTLGTLFTGSNSFTNTDVNVGVIYCWSYALLTPPKTQTTTQTVELVYKMAINPIY